MALAAVMAQDGGNDVRGILKNSLRVPERKPILPLLADMQSVARQHPRGLW